MDPGKNSGSAKRTSHDCSATGQGGKGRQPASADKAERAWYQNADEIATALASINPYWPKTVWERLLYDHLAMTKTEAVDLLTKKYSKSIEIYDSIEREALEMADVMLAAIVKQFPQRFVC